MATDQVKTAGDATKIELSADRNVLKATGKDLSFITVRITDENGILVPDGDNLLHFDIEGEGKIVGVCQRKCDEPGTRKRH